MAIYRSNLVAKATRHRGIYEGQDYDVAGRLFFASGTALTTADDLLFVPVGENQVIQKVSLLVLGDTAAGAGSIGRFQQLDANGQPAVVYRNGESRFAPAGTAFTSPATSAALYRAAGQLDGYTETIIAVPEKLAGPVNVGIRITTGFTFAADTEIFLGVYFKGETSEVEVVDPFGYSNDYLLDLPTP